MNDMTQNTAENDIAIVGMAAHLPGAASIEQYWANLRAGVESIRQLTPEELLANGENTLETYHPQILKAKIREENDEKMLEITALIDLFDNQENLDIVTQMKKLVPEFKSNNSIYSKLD